MAGDTETVLNSSPEQKNVLLLPGDGVGAELTDHAERVLKTLSPAGVDIVCSRADIGGAAIDAHGVPLPEATLEQLARTDAVLLGAVGGPRWDQLPVDKRPERALLELRKRMGVFANLRPLKTAPALAAQSPLKNDRLHGLDILIVRELTGGIYFGEPRGEKTDAGVRSAFNTMVYSETEIERIARLAFDLAAARNQRLCSVDKANVLEVSRLWRSVVTRIARDYPQVKVEHMYVDNAAMQLVINPAQFDVVLTSNLFGDILSDLGAAVVGSIGMLPSASVNGTGAGLFEPVHGSAPDLAGLDQANPLGMLYSLAWLLRVGLGLEETAQRLDNAIDKALVQGLRTADIAPAGTTADSSTAMVDAVCATL